MRLTINRITHTGGKNVKTKIMEILFLPRPHSQLHLKSRETPHRGGKAISVRPYVDFSGISIPKRSPSNVRSAGKDFVSLEL